MDKNKSGPAMVKDKTKKGWPGEKSNQVAAKMIRHSSGRKYHYM